MSTITIQTTTNNFNSYQQEYENCYNAVYSFTEQIREVTAIIGTIPKGGCADYKGERLSLKDMKKIVAALKKEQKPLIAATKVALKTLNVFKKEIGRHLKNLVQIEAKKQAVNMYDKFVGDYTSSALNNLLTTKIDIKVQLYDTTLNLTACDKVKQVTPVVSVPMEPEAVQVQPQIVIASPVSVEIQTEKTIPVSAKYVDVGFGDSVVGTADVGFGDSFVKAVDVGFGDSVVGTADVGFGDSFVKAVDVGFGDYVVGTADFGFGDSVVTEPEVIASPVSVPMEPEAVQVQPQIICAVQVQQQMESAPAKFGSKTFGSVNYDTKNLNNDFPSLGESLAAPKAKKQVMQQSKPVTLTADQKKMQKLREKCIMNNNFSIGAIKVHSDGILKGEGSKTNIITIGSQIQFIRTKHDNAQVELGEIQAARSGSLIEESDISSKLTKTLYQDAYTIYRKIQIRSHELDMIANKIKEGSTENLVRDYIDTYQSLKTMYNNLSVYKSVYDKKMNA